MLVDYLMEGSEMWEWHDVELGRINAQADDPDLELIRIFGLMRREGMRACHLSEPPDEWFDLLARVKRQPQQGYRASRLVQALSGVDWPVRDLMLVAETLLNSVYLRNALVHRIRRARGELVEERPVIQGPINVEGATHERHVLEVLAAQTSPPSVLLLAERTQQGFGPWATVPAFAQVRYVEAISRLHERGDVTIEDGMWVRLPVQGTEPSAAPQAEPETEEGPSALDQLLED